jgi:type IV pilus assembly protein PilM
LRAFVQEKKVGKTPVVVALPGFAALFREFSLPAASASRLDEIVSYEAKQLIPYPLEEVIYGYHELRRDPDTGEITVALLCCRRDIIQQLLSVLDEMGLNVEALQVGPVALVNYILYDAPPEDAIVILDTGARGSDFVVVNDGSFWLRSIGISGADLSKALMSKFSIPYDRAEALKREMGDSKQADRVFRVMAPVLNNLCAEVQRSIGYYKSLFRGAQFGEMVCAGNTYLLAGVDQFVADHVNLPTRTLSVPETLTTHFSVDPNEVEANRQVLGTAAGLALQGVGLAEVDVNLLPYERRLRRTIAAKVKFAAAAVGFIVVTVLVNLLFAGGQAERFSKLVEEASAANGQAGKQKGAYEKIKKQFAPEIQKSRALANVSSTRGYILETGAQVLEPLEEWNETQDELIRRGSPRHPAPKTKKQAFAELYEGWGEYIAALDKDDENYELILKNLRSQIERRMDWRYDRLWRIFCNDLSCTVTKYRRKVKKDNRDEVTWMPAEGEIAPERGYTSKDVDVVEIKLAGFMVFTEKRGTTDQAEFVKFKDSLEKREGVIPKTFSHVLRTANTTNAIRVPEITEPKPPGETDVEERPMLKFESVEEPVGEFEIKFMYLPRG